MRASSSRPRSSASRTPVWRSSRKERSSCASATLPPEAAGHRSRRCSRSRRRTSGSSSAGCAPAARSLVESDEPRDTHMVAALVGYGADVGLSATGARRPSRSWRRPTRSAATGRIPPRRSGGCLRALEDGVLKVMSKMGISDVASYRGARLFEAIGLDRRLCRRFLGGTPSGVGGMGLDRLEREALDRLAASAAERPELENPGFYKFRKGGEPHATTPEVVEALQASVAEAHALRAAVRGQRTELYDRFAALCQRALADRAARPARAAARRRARADRRGRARRVDRAPLLRRRHVARRALGRGARDDRGGAQPARGALQLR